MYIKGFRCQFRLSLTFNIQNKSKSVFPTDVVTFLKTFRRSYKMKVKWASWLPLGEPEKHCANQLSAYAVFCSKHGFCEISSIFWKVGVCCTTSWLPKACQFFIFLVFFLQNETKRMREFYMATTRSKPYRQTLWIYFKQFLTLMKRCCYPDILYTNNIYEISFTKYACSLLVYSSGISSESVVLDNMVQRATLARFWGKNAKGFGLLFFLRSI